MTYEITPEHFGFTILRQVLFAAGLLTCFTLGVFIPSWISSSYPWSWRDVYTAILTWFFFEIWWYCLHSYSIDVDENSIRSGGRVVRKGHIRYLRESNNLFRGRRLVISERGPVWVHLLGGVIEIPKGIPEYEKIRAEVLTWRQ